MGVVSMQLQKIRKEKYTAQGRRCFYCEQPMWSGSSKHFQLVHSISERQARWFQCTAEHLLAASEGGSISPTNIVAACKFCNNTRHRSKQPLSPKAYKQKVLSRLEAGRWLRLDSPTT
ncbi:HNH endonuclease [uncultured Roseovarius sp.]|uniref:HNH endonuclease n=2 Tax=Roseovarius TaxID=74030 RepID=UPI0034170A1F